jgi:hypothetical protein
MTFQSSPEHSDLNDRSKAPYADLFLRKNSVLPPEHSQKKSQVANPPCWVSVLYKLKNLFTNAMPTVENKWRNWHVIFKIPYFLFDRA